LKNKILFVSRFARLFSCFANPCLISLVPISKLLLSMLRFDICDDELTNTNPPLSLYEFGIC